MKQQIIMTTKEFFKMSEPTMLEKQVAESCGISHKDAQNEIDSAVNILKADIEDGYEIDLADVEDAMNDLGLDINDDNIESFLWRLL